MEYKKYLKILLAIAASLYFVSCAAQPETWHFVDNVNLLIHEAGHVVFSFFGQFMYVLGGSLLQVLIPMVFVGYFYLRDQRFSAALVLFWVGQNLLSVSVYAADAITMQLPLLGGDSSGHDWNWLLIYVGELRHTPEIAFVIRAAGTLVIIAAGIWALYEATRIEESVVVNESGLKETLKSV